MKHPHSPRPIAAACAGLAVVLALTAGAPRVIAQSPPGSAPQAAGGAPLTPEALDNLVAPIALYPDALILQIVQCATSPYQVKQVNDWLKQNPDLKGTAAQDGASQQGFDMSFVAIVIFPEVLQMMVDKPEWTRDLGQAFVTNRGGVLDAVQRMRTKAKAAGNLETNTQQQVNTVTVDGGQQVIVIEPANPQVVYVPQYDPQVVYVTQTTGYSSGQVVGAGLVGFAAGVIIGAAVDDDDDHFYYGCGGWGYHGAACWSGGYHDYYEHREDMANDFYDHREKMAEIRNDRQENRGENRQGRQDNRDARRDNASQNRGDRVADRAGARDPAQAAARDANRAAARDNLSQRQGASGQLPANRAPSNQINRQPTTTQRPNASQGANRSSQVRGNYGTAQSSQQRSNAFSGYQRGSTERASSNRGSQSISRSSYGGGSRGGASRGGGGRGGGGGGGRGGRR